MNRRRVLQSAAVGGTVALAGCVDGVLEHFEGSVQGVIPIEIESRAEEPLSIYIEANERQTGRQTYEEGITVSQVDGTVSPANMERTGQRVSFAMLDPNERTEIDGHRTTVTEDTQLVLIRLYDDELVVEIDHGDDEEILGTPPADDNADA